MSSAPAPPGRADGRAACYPGSFNPLTLAHLAIAEAAFRTCAVDRVDLIVSRIALGKDAAVGPSFTDRLAVLRAAALRHAPWLAVEVTDAQLLVDLATGYDVLVLGADKWAQVLDPAFYGGSETRRDDAVAALPTLALAPRPGALEVMAPPGGSFVLQIPDHLAEVSSTGVRAGRRHWMAPEAEALDAATGAWSDPARYRLRSGVDGTSA